MCLLEANPLFVIVSVFTFVDSSSSYVYVWNKGRIKTLMTNERLPVGWSNVTILIDGVSLTDVKDLC